VRLFAARDNGTALLDDGLLVAPGLCCVTAFVVATAQSGRL
jgi:hypothetical protein